MRKVLGLLSVQLIITAISAVAFISVPSVKGFVAANTWTLFVSMGLSIVLVLVLACSEQARRSHPTNLILLFAFTACQALLVGASCATFDASVVVLAMAITATVVAGLVLFTLQTKTDLTSMGGVLYSLCLTLLAAGIMQMIFHASWLHTMICAGGAALFSVYLIFDLQLIMGNGQLALSPDEYVLATLNIYLDVINIFLYILQLVADLSKDNNN